MFHSIKDLSFNTVCYKVIKIHRELPRCITELAARILPSSNPFASDMPSCRHAALRLYVLSIISSSVIRFAYEAGGRGSSR